MSKSNCLRATHLAKPARSPNMDESFFQCVSPLQRTAIDTAQSHPRRPLIPRQRRTGGFWCVSVRASGTGCSVACETSPRRGRGSSSRSNAMYSTVRSIPTRASRSCGRRRALTGRVAVSLAWVPQAFAGSPQLNLVESKRIWNRAAHGAASRRRKKAT